MYNLLISLFIGVLIAYYTMVLVQLFFNNKIKLVCNWVSWRKIWIPFYYIFKKH